ncbi:MAG: anti-sigma factor antagonist [Chloroflexota bacterium]
MNVIVNTENQVTNVEIIGDIDSKTATQIQAEVTPLIQPETKILLNMSQVGYMSSAGLRFLLGTYRTGSNNNARIVLVGVNKEIEETMSITGFLRFFSIYDSPEAGLDALNEG